MSDEIRDRIAEVLARNEYERKDWSGCEGSRWERLPEPVRTTRIALRLPIADVLVRELGLSDARTWFSPAYVAPTGVIQILGSTTVLLAGAQREAASYRSGDDQTEIFVAYRYEPRWRRWDGGVQ